jgi:hypothetical protein
MDLIYPTEHCVMPSSKSFSREIESLILFKIDPSEILNVEIIPE